MANARKDDNYIPSLLAASSADSSTPVAVEADPTTKRLLVNATLSGGSISANTEYTEGDTDATITGIAAMWEDGSNTLRAVSAAKPLPVEIIAGAGSGGTASADDADFTAGTTNGTPAMGVYESSPSSVTDGDLGIIGITQGRRLKTSTTIDAALPAGTNAIGKLSANSGVDIGDVDVTSLPSIPTGTNAIGRVGHDITGIGHGVTTVTTAGTDVALAASTACKRVVIQSQTDNTSLIAVGGTGVDATVATGTGIILYPGDSFELEIDNLADVFIDSLVNGEGVRYTYFT